MYTYLKTPSSMSTSGTASKSDFDILLIYRRKLSNLPKTSNNAIFLLLHIHKNTSPSVILFSARRSLFISLKASDRNNITLSVCVLKFYHAALRIVALYSG